MNVDIATLRSLLSDGGTCHVVSTAELRALIDAYERYAKARTMPFRENVWRANPELFDRVVDAAIAAEQQERRTA